MKLIKFLSVLVLSLSVLSPALAQESKPDQYVKIRLLPERNVVRGGDDIMIGIEQSIYPGWHTYWINPGDSGAAPRIEWALPDGSSIGDIHWPAPDKIPYGPLMNFGYSDNVILLQKLSLPKDIPVGPITLTARVEILVCKDICIPEFGEYELVLNDPLAPKEDNNAYLMAAQRKLPVPVPWNAAYDVQGENVVLKLETGSAAILENIEPGSFDFFPVEWGLISNPGKMKMEIRGGDLILTQLKGERSLNELNSVPSVLAFTNSAGERQAVSFIAAHGDIARVKTASAASGLVKALLLALLGGLILNLMPCVFPVLSIKALSLAKAAEKEAAHVRLSGLSYTAGVVLSFVAIAAGLIALKSAGAGIGWGFQLQDPLVVALLAYLLFIIGLNLTGVFEISGHFGTLGDRLTQGTGLTSAFFTGVLATLVATPCTAPFMAAAVGYALIQPAFVALSIFAALGLGLALPYLILSFVPALQRVLPKPGAWMETFRQFLAFPMFASSVWLVWVLSQQTDAMGLLHILIGLVMLAFGFWLLNHSPGKITARSIVQILAALAFLSAAALLPFGDKKNEPARVESLSFGEEYSPARLANLLLSDEPVFVEMTAAWCITCKVNHAVAINTQEIKSLFAKKNIRYLVGDWTNYDESITDYLNSYGRSGVPIYVYYGPRDIVTGERPEAKLLPQILTPGIVAEAVNSY